MERMTTLFKEIVTIQQERNEMLKDSIYAEFALSDEQVIEEAQSVFDKEFAKKLTKKIQEEVVKL
tara:strand:- start:307 stop:501 length:195 start_codon:yes stop_codon:yes gene_type:complete